MTSHRDFGWWIESTDEEIYGPVTRTALTRFLTEGVISPNTAVRHCTDPKFAPIADLGMTDGLNLPASRRTGDTMSEAWPKKTKDRLALGESDVECAYHKRPAILTCIRCQAPYCVKCRMKSGKKNFFMCKKCQGNVYNRRVGAYFIDSFLIIAIPVYAIGIPAVFALGAEVGSYVLNLMQFAGTAGFFCRDALFKGAGPGKRFVGLRVVKAEDGTSNLTFGQGFLRSLPHLIPFFNLVDAHVVYGDPLHRRFGDKWAKTRALDTEARLEKIRSRTRDKLAKKGIEMSDTPLMTLQEFAQTD